MKNEVRIRVGVSEPQWSKMEMTAETKQKLPSVTYITLFIFMLLALFMSLTLLLL
jgi:hypothetical protein